MPTVSNTGAASAAPAVLEPFTKGTLRHREPGPEATQAFGTSIQNMELPASGFLRSVKLLVSATAAGNSATVAFKADAPWSAIGEITLLDATGVPLINPITGYELFLVNKWGGYEFDGDPTRSQVYSVTTGSGATGGSFAFALILPVEIVSREAFGALGNQNSSSPFRVRITLGASADVYSTAPTVVPTVTVKSYIDTWMVPSGKDPISGIPYQVFPTQHGVTQQWSKQEINTIAAYQTLRLQQIGNHIRNIIFVTRDSSGVRVDTSFPTSYTWEFNGAQLDAAFPASLLREQMQETYGYAAAQMDTGVYVFAYTDDLDGHPGGELREQYLRTSTGSRLELKGTFGAGAAGGKVTVLTNDIRVPASIGALV